MSSRIALFLCALTVAGCAGGLLRERMWYQVNARKKVDYVPIAKGALKAPCTIRSNDGRYSIPSGEFEIQGLPEWATCFKGGPGEFDRVSDWGDLFIFGMGEPVTITCGSEQFNGRLFLAGLPRQFAMTPAFRYDIEIGEAAWKAARDGYIGFASGLHRWGWAGEDLADRITWMLMFTKSPLPPLTPTVADVTRAAAASELKLQ